MDVNGAGDGIAARNFGNGALSITATGTVTGTDNIGIFARNNGTDLTIDAVDVSGEAGITGRNYGRAPIDHRHRHSDRDEQYRHFWHQQGAAPP